MGLNVIIIIKCNIVSIVNVPLLSHLALILLVWLIRVKFQTFAGGLKASYAKTRMNSQSVSKRSSKDRSITCPRDRNSWILHPIVDCMRNLIKDLIRSGEIALTANIHLLLSFKAIALNLQSMFRVRWRDLYWGEAKVKILNITTHPHLDLHQECPSNSLIINLLPLTAWRHTWPLLTVD